MIKEIGGGYRDISRGGYDTKKGLFNEIQAIISGIEINKLVKELS